MTLDQIQNDLPMLQMVMALMLGCIGVSALRLGWESQSKLKGLILWMGWLVLMISGIYWIQFAGAEFGVVYLSIIPGIVAGLMIVIGSEYRPQKWRDQQAEAKPMLTTSVRHRAGTFLVVGPLAGLVSCPVILFIAISLPVEQRDAMIIAALGYPVLWALLAIWCCFQSLRRSTLVLMMAGLMGTLGMYW